MLQRIKKIKKVKINTYINESNFNFNSFPKQRKLTIDVYLVN